MSKSVNCIYTELDVLLDTRIATVALMNPEAAVRAVSSGYHEREADIFLGIDTAEFKKRYKARDIETLKKCYPTNAIALIRHFLTIMLEQNVQRPDVSGARLEVNVWPYVLPPEILEEYLFSIRTMFREITDVSLINVAPKDLSIADCKNSYKFMLMYEYEEWLESRVNELATVQAPELVVFSPAIYHVRLPTEAELATLRNGIPPMHPFEATLFEIRPFVGLQLLDIKHFSLLSPN